METVHKCASDPKTNREWLDSENPWQTLSSMIELSAAIKSGILKNIKVICMFMLMDHAMESSTTQLLEEIPMEEFKLT